MFYRNLKFITRIYPFQVYCLVFTHIYTFAKYSTFQKSYIYLRKLNIEDFSIFYSNKCESERN